VASPHPLHISVENADELLNGGALGSGAVLEIQSSATELGTYAAISGTGSTPTIPLVSGTRSYTGYNPGGDWATWYRVRYRSSDSTRVSVDWTGDTLWYTRAGHAPFQVGAEEGGSICSIYDVEQRLTGTVSPNDRELLLEFIADATADLMGYCERRFIRNPLSGSTTFLFDVARSTTVLRVPEGIATATQLEVATTSQPESAGTYTIVTAADWFLRPIAHERTYGWPATEIHLTDMPTGTVSQFSAGYNTARLTGALGWAAVPADVAGIGVNVIIRRYQARGSGVATALGSEDFGARILRWTSPEEREKLNWYRRATAA